MSTKHYVMDPGPDWHIDTRFNSVFTWDYDDRRENLVKLYEKGKDKQWNANDRLDWSLDVDPHNPNQVPDSYVAIYGSPWWNKMNDAEKANMRHHVAAWTSSQFLHGEQGALICASKIVCAVPDADAKFYAATQVMDEARHVEVYDRYLREKLELCYPINQELKVLLEDVVNDSRWDFTYLGMQIMIEGLALAAFGLMRDFTNEPLFTAINTYVMQDEARHVAFGVQALDTVYSEMSEVEKGEREDFIVQASYLMCDRLMAPEVWEYFGLPLKEVLAYVTNSAPMREFRKHLFSRIVPMVKKIGLLGPKVQACFEDIGVMGFHTFDADAAFERDDELGDVLDELIRLGYSPEEAMTKFRADDVSKTIALGKTV